MKDNQGYIRIKYAGKMRQVWVSDVDNCKDYTCFHPHNCPVQGAKGVRSSDDRWMCLTNALQGCPDVVISKKKKKKKTMEVDQLEWERFKAWYAWYYSKDLFLTNVKKQ